MPIRFFPFLFLSAAFFSCKAKNSPDDTASWKLKGDSLVTRTFDTLRNTLQHAVGEKGFAGAVDFCITAAPGLTAAYNSDGIFVKRTSDKLRNPANAPDTMEKRIMAAYLQMKNDKKQLEGILEKDAAGNHHYFKPILLQALCLNCHGDNESQIKPDTRAAIQKQYPADAAFNYKEGDLRGIWHISFYKSKSNPDE
jgi:hypothetical protein